MKRIPLTKRQQAILGFINKFTQANHYPPSVMDIGKQFGIYRNAAHQHLRLIEKKGYIKRVPHTARGIVIL